MAPVLHRIITLSGSHRMSRRAMLTNLGAAGVGLTILGACGGSADDAAPARTGPAGTDTTLADTVPADTVPIDTVPAAGASIETELDQPDGSANGATLQMQHVSLGFVSAYVLLRGNEAAVVDTGQSDSASSILDGLGALGATWADVGHIVLTHNHGDHAGGLADVLAEAPGAAVYAGEADLGRIRSSATLQAIGDGDEVLGMGVLNTPGHTEGSISLFDTETGILVAGDAINGRDGTLTGANEQYSANMVMARASIAKMAALDPAVAAFGHGGAPISDNVAEQLSVLAAS
jgi:glyoxylase-like metal-dependent hydrolase (beta-lactamase superfamily II)